MSVIKLIVDRFDLWTAGPGSHPGDRRHMVGSWAAKSVLQYFAVEYLVMLSWTHYDYLFNMVSDLGARNCNDLVPTSLCPSSSFIVADLSFIFLGVGTMTAASLITTRVLRVGGHVVDFKNVVADGRDRRLTIWFRWFLGITGLALIGIGVFPEDYLRGLHIASTVVVLMCAIFSLALLGTIWRQPRPLTSIVLFIAAGVAAVGGLFLAGIALARLMNIDVSQLPGGFFERLVIYGFIFGVFVMGWTLSNAARRQTSKDDPKKRGAEAFNATPPSGDGQHAAAAAATGDEGNPPTSLSGTS